MADLIRKYNYSPDAVIEHVLGSVDSALQASGDRMFAIEIEASPIGKELKSGGKGGRDSNGKESFVELTREVGSGNGGVVPFDFTAPSPDDVVLEKQKQAFTKKKKQISANRANRERGRGKQQQRTKKNGKVEKKEKEEKKVEGVKKVEPSPRKQVKQMPASKRKQVCCVYLSSFPSHSLLQLLQKIETSDTKHHLNLVVIGHVISHSLLSTLSFFSQVDAGKSTLMGHLLYLAGDVDNKTMKKYEHESEVIGKGSFSFAWVLDQHGEERERGVTIDVAVSSFETKTKVSFFLLLLLFSNLELENYAFGCSWTS